MSDVRDYIPRTLSWTDAALKTRTVGDKEIVSRFSEPIVILGDPGIGKTWLMELLGAQDGHQFIRATSPLRQPDGHSFGNTRLVIDGLDEVAAINESDPLHNVLTKLVACPRATVSSFHCTEPSLNSSVRAGLPSMSTATATPASWPTGSSA